MSLNSFIRRALFFFVGENRAPGVVKVEALKPQLPVKVEAGVLKPQLTPVPEDLAVEEDVAPNLIKVRLLD